jgi:3'(2'), 5'-bisphosphate nucleotidase
MVIPYSTWFKTQATAKYTLLQNPNSQPTLRAMSLPYEKERFIAELAVQRAAILTQTVLKSLTNRALTKTDKTSVTVADFGSQALLISAVRHNFPNDRIIGEENADMLRADSELQKSVWELVSNTHLEDSRSEKLLGAMGPVAAMLDAIDLGRSAKDAREGRVWVMDPIDGTEEFIKGKQYAVCLALLVDGEQTVGVLGCPNLDLNASDPFGDPAANTDQSTGALISATRDQGSTVRALSTGTLLPSRPLPKLTPNTTALRMTDNLRTSSSDLKKHSAVANHFSASWPSPNIWALQLRWVALATGIADFCVRIPEKDKHDWIWDHAGGVLIAEEAGVKVTDVRGKAIDFKRGQKFEGNCGWVAAAGELHGDVLNFVGKIVREGDDVHNTPSYDNTTQLPLSSAVPA